MDLYSISATSLLGRAMRLPLKLIPSSAQVRVLRGPLRGKIWIVGSSAHGCWLGTTEADKQTAIAHAIKPGQVVYDLGANVGHYTLLATSLVGPLGKVFAFEPLPRNLAFLRKHLELNHVTNCTIWEAAVGNAEGASHFYLNSGPFKGHLTADSENTLSVKVVTLDGLVASGQLPPPHVIKCDIEGGEYDALLGASIILDRYAPTIFLATHGPEVHRKCYDFLLSLGYQVTSLNSAPADSTNDIMAVRPR